MKFINHSKEQNLDLCWNLSKGSSRQGYVGCTYKELVETFGEPYLIPEEDQDRIKAEWVIEWEDGTISIIYDWKWFDTPLENIEEWNVGGFDYKAALYVQEKVGC